MTRSTWKNIDEPRILIIRLSAMGDIVHTLPLLAALRERWPDARIGWLCEPIGVPLLKGHPLIDTLHLVPKKEMKANFWAAARGPARHVLDEIKAERYNCAIDVQGLTKSAVWAWLAGIPRRIGFARPDARELAPVLNNERVRPSAFALHIVERNLSLLKPLGIEPPEEPIFPVLLTEAARRRAVEILGEPKKEPPVFAISPGAGWATKIWPADRFGMLARQLAGERAARVVVAWGPGEEDLAREVLRAAGRTAEIDFRQLSTVPAEPGVYPLPPTRIDELAAVIARTRLFVGGDTGPTHLAAALNIPTVSMMGPLDARRNGPYGAHCITIQHAIPRRAPWWRNHRRWCDPRTEMARIGVEEVHAACMAQLERFAQRPA